jgi:8-amino-7-oxononanoate synthase
VDEAHATGVAGANGEGLVCALGLEKDVFARVHTFGKALGCHGAVVVGSSLLRSYLINFARSFIYTTALPPHSVAVIDGVYRYLAAPGFTNEGLHKNIRYFRDQAKAAGVRELADSDSAIQAIITGGNENTRSLAQTIQQAGYRVNAILHPTVPEGMERLRICLHTFNTFREIDELIQLLPKRINL